jgi:hypothetical protein
MQIWASVVSRGSARLNCGHLASQAMRPCLSSTRSYTSSNRGWALLKFGLTCRAAIGPVPGCMGGSGVKDLWVVAPVTASDGLILGLLDVYSTSAGTQVTYAAERLVRVSILEV